MKNHHDSFEHALANVAGRPRLSQRITRPAEFIVQDDAGQVDIPSLLKRYFALALVMVVGGMLIALAQLVLQTPLYKAQLLLEIQPINKELGVMDPFAALHDMDGVNVQTQLILLQSGPFKHRVLTRMWSMPPPSPPASAGIFSKIRTRLRRSSMAEDVSLDNSLRTAASTLDARVVNQTRLVELSCESPNPVVTSSFLNAFAEEFVQDSIQEREEASAKTTAWLTSHLEDTRAKLQDADARMRAFVLRSGNEFASSDKTVDDVKLKQLQSELATAQAVEIGKQAAYETAVKSPHDAIPELTSDNIAVTIRGQLADLEKQKAILLITLTPLNPKVVAIQDQERNLESALEKEEADLLARLQSEYESARNHERLLYSAYASESGQVSSQSSKATEYAALRREVDGFQKMYDSLMEELNKTQVAQSAPVNPVRLVEPSAPPTVPYTPQPKSTLMLGSLGGLAMAVAIAFMREKMDRRLRSPESLQSLVRVPQLGVIPEAPSEGRMRNWVASKHPSKTLAPATLFSTAALNPDERRDLAQAAWGNGAISLIADSFRATLASIQRQLSEEQSAKLIMVTSSTPGEGKTTVVSNLGIALSEAGRRVVIVDADFRRPCLSNVFGLDTSISLPHILEDTRAVEEYPTASLAAQSRFPGLYVLPSIGSNTQIPTLIYSKRLPRVLWRLQREFDLVLIDVPPILFPADARVVAQLVDAAVLIIRSAHAEKENIRAAVNVLHEDGVPILGTVLNGWSSSGARSGIGYYNYYGKQNPKSS